MFAPRLCQLGHVVLQPLLVFLCPMKRKVGLFASLALQGQRLR